jgi:hypothetical protein
MGRFREIYSAGFVFSNLPIFFIAKNQEYIDSRL